MAEKFDINSLNAAQKQAVQTLNGPVLILAGAGTGKTRTVTCRIANMIEQGVTLPASLLLHSPIKPLTKWQTAWPVW